jgi:uncharacterized membrane protein YcaP (DUF421 family)
MLAFVGQCLVIERCITASFSGNLYQTSWNLLHNTLGLEIEAKQLTFAQITIRGVIVFVAALIMMRIGDRRALSRKTAFDAILIVLLGSVLARAINGSAPFFATVGASFVIVILHRLVAQAGFHSRAFGNLIKGSAKTLVEDGQYCRAAMRRTSISEDDVEEDMRLSAKIQDIAKVKVARLERSGDLSFMLDR